MKFKIGDVVKVTDRAVDRGDVGVGYGNVGIIVSYGDDYDFDYIVEWNNDLGEPYGCFENELEAW